MMDYSDEFDFVAEHRKADVSMVECVRIHGKVFLAEDKVLRVLGQLCAEAAVLRKTRTAFLGQKYHDGAHAYLLAAIRRIEELKGAKNEICD